MRQPSKNFLQKTDVEIHLSYLSISREKKRQITRLCTIIAFFGMVILIQKERICSNILIIEILGCWNYEWFPISSLGNHSPLPPAPPKWISVNTKSTQIKNKHVQIQEQLLVFKRTEAKQDNLNCAYMKLLARFRCEAAEGPAAGALAHTGSCHKHPWHSSLGLEGEICAEGLLLYLLGLPLSSRTPRHFGITILSAGTHFMEKRLRIRN